MFIRTRKNVLLIELIVVIFFFSISAAITLQVFALAYQRSHESSDTTFALVIAQDWAEQSSMGADPEETLIEGGWIMADGLYLWNGEGKFPMTAEISREATAAGEIVSVVFEVYIAGPCETKLLYTLPVDRYIPGAGSGGGLG